MIVATRYTEEELWITDPLLQLLMGANCKLIELYWDTIHHNDGMNLDGSIDKSTWGFMGYYGYAGGRL